MTATLPTSGGPWAFVSCPDTGPAAAVGASPDGTTQTLTVPVPNGGTGTGKFFVVHQSDALTMKKTAAQPYFSGAGQALTFDFLVTNSGNVGMANVGITDTLAGVTGLSCPETSLGAGAVGDVHGEVHDDGRRRHGAIDHQQSHGARNAAQTTRS